MAEDRWLRNGNKCQGVPYRKLNLKVSFCDTQQTKCTVVVKRESITFVLKKGQIGKKNNKKTQNKQIQSELFIFLKYNLDLVFNKTYYYNLSESQWTAVTWQDFIVIQTVECPTAGSLIHFYCFFGLHGFQIPIWTKQGSTWETVFIHLLGRF